MISWLFLVLDLIFISFSLWQFLLLIFPIALEKAFTRLSGWVVAVHSLIGRNPIERIRKPSQHCLFCAHAVEAESLPFTGPEPVN